MMDDNDTQQDIEASNGSLNQAESSRVTEYAGEYTDVPVSEMVVKQSLPVDGNESVRCSPMLKVTTEPIAYFEKETRTLHDVFLRGLKFSNGGPCIGWRPGPDQAYQWITYQQVLDRSQHFGSGLIAEGAQTNPKQFIGIFAQNRVEWKITEQACNSFSMVVVPLYDTLGPQSIQHIINQCELKIIVVDNNIKAKTLLSECKEGSFKIELIINMESPNDEVKTLAEETGVIVRTFAEIEEAGKEKLQDFVPPSPSDLHTICYTSGTTGLPKGVMLTHGNLVANHSGVFGVGEKTFIDIKQDDVYISYLPLAHVFERLLAMAVYYVGGSVGFFQGDVKLLLDDVATLRPTIFAMVPRLINRIYDKVWSGVSQSFIKSFLLRRAVKSKMAILSKGIVTKDTLWDKIVFRKIQNMMGGSVRICITGAAPVSLEVLNFMRVALGVNFTEGYGQTEATAGICISLPGDFLSGSVGTPTLCNLVKLVDVPEKNYFAKDGKGEICAKGTNIFVGYYKDEAKTKETLDEDGWLHTGDVGMWLPNGSLKIIDRKKHIFKLAQGEYIAPEKIEGILVQSPAVAQVFLYGESLKASLVAVVIPDPETIESWCDGNGIRGSYEELCKNEDVNKLILEDLQAVGKLRGLHSFELPRKILLSSELFSVQNNLLTPTFKSRRPQIYNRYKEDIDKMYSDLQ